MAEPPFWMDPAWRRRVLRDAFGPGFWGFFAFAVAVGAICYRVQGPEQFLQAIGNDIDALLAVLPRALVALAVAALIWAMLPRDRLSAMVGREAGLAGLVIATLAGAVTPGGPTSAYALLAVLGASGADRGAMVAYIVSWSLLGLQRVLIWDVPFMGAEFAMLRLAVNLPLPVLAGLVARRLPFTLAVRRDPPAPREDGGEFLP